MSNGVLRKVTELSIDTRHAMESVLGRSLEEDEAISISVYKPAPTGKARGEAARRLLDRIDQIAQRTKDIPEEELEAAIDEALDHARHHRE